MPEARLARWFERRWYAARAPWYLRPFAALFGGIVALRSAAYRSGLIASGHPGVPVVVVGNLTVGGTGKTPFTLWLAGALRARGVRVGIASRGYGGSTQGSERVDPAGSAARYGDESLLLARRSGVPVCVARRRLQAAQHLAAEGCELVLADDGLQHLALRRDFSIVVIDAARGFGNGRLLPAGPLREPPSRIAAADAVVVQGAEPPAAVRAHPLVVCMSLAPGPLRALRGGEEKPLAAFAGQRVHAVAGIGHPDRFFGLLRAAGIEPIAHAFPDHHPFVPQDLDFADTLPVLMTEKDAVKCLPFADGRMWCLPVAAEPDPAGAARLLERVLRLLPRGGTSLA
ncbi:MAG: tetraacyldisaccharide 4'-kinase [Steroidobacteraceae bacterium]